MEKRTANGPKKNSLGTGESVRVSGYLVRVSPNRLVFYRLNLRRFIQRSSDKGGDGGLQRTLFRVTENANDAPFAWKWVIFIIFVWIRIGAGEIKKSYFQENLYDAKVFVAQQKRQKRLMFGDTKYKELSLLNRWPRSVACHNLLNGREPLVQRLLASCSTKYSVNLLSCDSSGKTVPSFPCAPIRLVASEIQARALLLSGR